MVTQEKRSNCECEFMACWSGIRSLQSIHEWYCTSCPWVLCSNKVMTQNLWEDCQNKWTRNFLSLQVYLNKMVIYESGQYLESKNPFDPGVWFKTSLSKHIYSLLTQDRPFRLSTSFFKFLLRMARSKKNHASKFLVQHGWIIRQIKTKKWVSLMGNTHLAEHVAEKCFSNIPWNVAEMKRILLKWEECCWIK